MDNEIISSKKMIRLTKSTTIFLALSILFGLVFISFNAFEFSLIDTLGPFILGPLLFLLKFFNLIFILISFFYLLVKIRKEKISASFPLLTNVLIFLIIFFVPFTNIWLDIEFHKNYDGYNKVIELINKSEIDSANAENGFIKLPLKYVNLSRGGGEIMIDSSDGVLRVFFFTYRGMLDNISGFMYKSDSTSPNPQDQWADWVQIIKYSDHWYFCASN